MSAAEKGRTEVVKMLLAKGARAKAVNHQKKTARDFAEQAGHTDVVALLK